MSDIEPIDYYYVEFVVEVHQGTPKDLLQAVAGIGEHSYIYFSCVKRTLDE